MNCYKSFVTQCKKFDKIASYVTKPVISYCIKFLLSFLNFLFSPFPESKSTKIIKDICRHVYMNIGFARDVIYV